MDAFGVYHLIGRKIKFIKERFISTTMFPYKTPHLKHSLVNVYIYLYIYIYTHKKIKLFIFG